MARARAAHLVGAAGARWALPLTAITEELPIYYNIVCNDDAVSPALAAALNGEFAQWLDPITLARVGAETPTPTVTHNPRTAGNACSDGSILGGLGSRPPDGGLAVAIQPQHRHLLPRPCGERGSAGETPY